MRAETATMTNVLLGMPNCTAKPSLSQLIIWPFLGTLINHPEGSRLPTYPLFSVATGPFLESRTRETSHWWRHSRHSNRPGLSVSVDHVERYV